MPTAPKTPPQKAPEASPAPGKDLRVGGGKPAKEVTTPVEALAGLESGGPRKVQFGALPKRMDWGRYQVDVPWEMLLEQITSWDRSHGFDMDPDYQRGHVWTETQQKAYVEFTLSGGANHANLLLFNCRGWSGHNHQGPIEVVDGKQRLTAALKFLRGELSVFDDVPNIGPVQFRDLVGFPLVEIRFRVFINSLESREDVLRWYLELNSGGTVHTDDELNKVRRMLAKEAS